MLVAARPEPYGGWAQTRTWVGVGMALGLFGLSIRAWAILGAAPGTSGRATRIMRADSLNISGAYAWVRHPLYFGNLLLWLGVAAVSGRPAAILAAIAWFPVVYGRIAAAEDSFLRAQFGSRFDEWAVRTPSLLPRLWSRRAPGESTTASARPIQSDSLARGGLAYSVRRAVARDYHAAFAFVASTWIVAGARASGWPGGGWTAYLSVGVFVFLVAHVLKRRTALLDAPAGPDGTRSVPGPRPASGDHDSGGQ